SSGTRHTRAWGPSKLWIRRIAQTANAPRAIAREVVPQNFFTRGISIYSLLASIKVTPSTEDLLPIYGAFAWSQAGHCATSGHRRRTGPRAAKDASCAEQSAGWSPKHRPRARVKFLSRRVQPPQKIQIRSPGFPRRGW